MPKGTKGYHSGIGGGTKYDPTNAPTKKNGGSKKMDYPDAMENSSPAPKYPKPDAGAARMAGGMTG